MTDLTPEVQAAIEEVLALHTPPPGRPAVDGKRWCAHCERLDPCPTVRKLSALLLPEDERVTELREAAADLVAWAGNDVVVDRLRAALQAFDVTEAGR